MAKTLGCISLVTDDIKERGPHYTLMRIPDSDVMPFAFYELLFLDYINYFSFFEYHNTISHALGIFFIMGYKYHGYIRLS